MAIKLIMSIKNLKKSINEIRKTSKPIFLEFSTYRWLEHCGPDDDTNLKYRSQKELDFWKKKDPLDKLKINICKNDKNSEKESF